MNILFLFARYPDDNKKSTLESELVNEFSKNNHNIYVSTILEKKFNKSTFLSVEKKVNILRIKTGNFRENVSKIEKGITQISIPYIFIKNIKKFLKNIKFDLIITSTPAMNSPYLLSKLKNYFKCKIMLILWDIFPQNAIDLKMLNNKILQMYFERQFKKGLDIVDYISTMSKGNMNYINNKYIDYSHKTFILKNWAQIKPKLKINKKDIRQKYGLNIDNFICVFGGNMGKPQKLENILDLAGKISEIDNITFLFIGKGTEKEKLKQLSNNKKNIIFMDYIERDDYEKLIGSCDIGIISLDERFTVPNFPSKTTDYCKLGLPILASLDKVSKKDYGFYLENNIKSGLCADAGNVNDLKSQLFKLYNDDKLRYQLGENGRKYYESNLGVDKAYKLILKKI